MLRSATVALLFLSMAAFCQPLEGPFTVLNFASMSSAYNPHVTLRNADTADVFYQLADTVFHAAVLLHDGAVASGPEVLITPRTSWTHTLYDALWNDGRWYALVYGNGEHSNVTTLIEGTNAQILRDTLSHEGDCPGSGSMWYCAESSRLRLQARPSGGCFAYWILDWQAHPYGGFEEGGRNVRISRVTSGGDTSWECQHPYWDTGSPILRAFPNDSLILFFGDGYEARLNDFRNNLSCNPIAEWECPLSTIAALWTREERFFVLSDQVGSLSPKLLELTGNTCTERLALTARPVAATAHTDYGIAWLWGGETAIYLNRADTTGAAYLLPGLIAEPQAGYGIGQSSLAIADNGHLAALWVDSSPLDSNSSCLRIASLGWNTPLGTGDSQFTLHPSSLILSASPNPFNSELRIEYELPKAQNVALEVFNLLGQRVATLYSGMKVAGTHTVTWAPQTGTGIYFVTLKTSESVRTTKVAYLR